jgi:hypothetical protein
MDGVCPLIRHSASTIMTLANSAHCTCTCSRERERERESVVIIS